MSSKNVYQVVLLILISGFATTGLAAKKPEIYGPERHHGLYCFRRCEKGAVSVQYGQPIDGQRLK